MNIIFGTGHTAECLLLYKDFLNIKYFVDNSWEKQADKFSGYNVYSPEKLLDEQYDGYDYIIIASEKYAYSMRRQCINDLGIKKEKIIIFHEKDIHTPWCVSKEIAKILPDDILQRKIVPPKKENSLFCGMYAKDKNVTFFLWGGKGHTKYVLEYLYNNYDVVVIEDNLVSKEQYGNGIHIICDEMEYGTPAERTIYLFRYMDIVYLNNCDYWNMFEKYQQHKKRAKAIVTGMSYFRDAFNCALLKIPAVKLACSSQDLFFDFMLFKKVYEEIGRNGLSHVFIGLAPYSLRYDLSLASSIEYLLFSYYSHLHTFHNNKKLDKAGKFVDEQEKRIEQYLDSKICEYIYKSCTGHVDSGQWNTFQLEFIQECDYMEVEEEYNKPYQATVVENKKILENYVSYCVSNNIKVYIILPPFTNWYKEQWDKSYYDELKIFIQEMRNNYEFIFLDFSEEYWENKYFYNNGHLNMYGSKRLMSILNTYL